MRQTIKNHHQFQTDTDAPLAVTPYFLAKCRPTLFPGDARYGLIVTKKTFKLAVDRNRAKRLIRVWIRECADMMSPDMDYIFIIRGLILRASKPEGVKTMKKALKQLANSELVHNA